MSSSSSLSPAPREWRWAELDPGGASGAPPVADAEEALLARHREEVDDAWRRGYAEGREAAAEEARRELASAMSVLRAAVEDVHASRSLWSSTLQDNLVVLAAGIARHIIDREVAADPGIFAEAVRRAVAAFPPDEPLRIRAHPADLDTLRRSETLPVADVIGERGVRWVPDEGMVPGGCVVEGPDRILDGRVDEALIRVVRALAHA